MLAWPGRALASRLFNAGAVRNGLRGALPRSMAATIDGARLGAKRTGTVAADEAVLLESTMMSVCEPPGIWSISYWRWAKPSVPQGTHGCLSDSSLNMRNTADNLCNGAQLLVSIY